MSDPTPAGATLTAITEQLRDRIASALSTYASNANLSVEAYTLILTNSGRMAEFVIDAIDADSMDAAVPS